ncbi:MAG: MmgE/PrpD family protein [bacterium]|jgi:2-methylcitrate dehydratase PrpD|nr:MmgE/PrpD family protein [Betaproteobacteria bacterium]
MNAQTRTQTSTKTPDQPTTPTLDLARFAAMHAISRAPGSPSAAALAEARRAFLNSFGCMLGGADDPAVDLLWSALRPHAGAPAARLFGRGQRTDALTAALVNGYSSNILDFDDTHLATVIHPGPACLSAVLAIAEAGPEGRADGIPGLTGAKLLDAFLVGMEVACRLGVAIGHGHYARGWHITGTCGVVGAAAATGRLLGLDPVRMTHALGIAATSATGLGEMLGGMSKSYNIARAGREGLNAALIAATGFTASLRVLEAPRGFAAVFAEGLDEAALTGGLGERWEAALDTYKPYPCGIVLHPLIDACLQVAAQSGAPAAAIERVEVKVHPLVLVLTGRTDPKDGLESKLSFTHACAVALADQCAGVDQFTDARAADPVIAALRGRIHPVVDESLGTDQSAVALLLADGRRFEARIEHATGSVVNPMTDAALDAKFLALATRTLGAEAARALCTMCRGIDGLDDLGPLFARAAGGG